jgi:small GTP-binding protein
MTNLSEKIAAIEKEIRETPYHKGTEHHLGQLKARLAKLKKRLKMSQKKKGGGMGFAVKKEGDATVVLVGPPSVGKSTLLNKLTGAHSRVEPWPFSTVGVVPGMMVYKGARIQIFDLPGIIGGAAKGAGRGKEVLAVAKVADLLLLVVDPQARLRIKSLLKEIDQAGIELEPIVVVNKTDLLKDSARSFKGAIWISAKTEKGLKELKELIWQNLKLIRVYLKPRNKEADRKEPLILKKGATVTEVAGKLFPQTINFKQILLWGTSARFPSQEVSLHHQLQDEDVLSFVV